MTNIKTMTVEEHVAKVNLIIDNTEELYKQKIAVFSVYDKRKSELTFERQLLALANKGITFTNLYETADPMVYGLEALQVASRVYADLLDEYVSGEWK